MSAILPNKTHKISRSGLTYAYIHYPPSIEEKPTLLFIHGFPATSNEWAPQIRHFRQLGYGILAPDCLGYGGSSKPLDVKLYGMFVSEDLLELFH